MYELKKKILFVFLGLTWISGQGSAQFYDVDFTAESPLAQEEASIIFADSWESGCWNAHRKDGAGEGSCADGVGNRWKQSQMQGIFSGRVVSHPVRCGNYAMRYEWRPENYIALEHAHSRNTLKKAMTHAGYAPGHTVERWYAFSVYLPSRGMMVDSHPMLFFQVHARADLHKNESWRQPIAAMTIEPGGTLSYSYTFDTSGVSPGNEMLAENRRTGTIGHISDFYDRWTDVVWHCRFNPFGGGLLEIWINGEKIADHRDIALGYNDELGGPQFSIGSYWYTGKADHNHWLFIDEVRIGNGNSRYEDVAPRGGKQLDIVAAKASGHEGNKDHPVGWCDGGDCDAGETIDGELGGKSIWMWQKTGVERPWLMLDLGRSRQVSYLKVAFFKGHQRNYFFDIQVSDTEDGPWKSISESTSGGRTDRFEIFSIPETTARYIRILGDGNSYEGPEDFAQWTNIYEVQVWGGP